MRVAVVAAAVILSVVGISMAEEAEASIRKATKIPAQALGAALQALAKERDFQVVYRSEVVDDLRTPGAAGELTVTEALTQLLSGTRLAYRYLDDKTITIVQAGTPKGEKGSLGNERKPSREGSGEEKKSLWQKLRLTQADPPSRSEEDKEGSYGENEKNRTELEEEVIVTGSRLKGSRVDEGPAPVTVFDRAKIEELGVTTLPEFFRYVTQQPFVKSEESMTGAGGQYVDLRGVGTGSTAVLIDGRPAAATASSGTFNALDLGSIPMAAIERIEILTSSASAVYGANAMGGAINIVLKRNIGRPVIDLHYGSADGGAEERRASLSTGYSNGRFRGSLLLDYLDRGELPGAERDRWANQDFRRFGSIDRRSTSANPTTVTSTTAANLPGLTSRFAAVPADSTGVGLTPADFAATAGQRNHDSLGRYRSIVGEQDRRSGTAFGEFSLTPALTVFGEFFHEESVSAIHLPPTTATLIVPAGNEFNPFDVPVSVTYLFTGVGPRKRYSEAESDRGLLGFKGDIHSWDWEVSAFRTKGDGLQRAPDNTVNLARVNAALAAVAPAETLNVFQDGPGGSPALLTSLVNAPSVDQRYLADTRQTSAQLRGPLWQLPAGALEVVVGGSRSEEEIEFHTISFTTPVAGDRTSSAAFAEIGVPLVAPALKIPAVSALRMTVAARYDKYSDFGDTLNPQYGLVWSPVTDVSVRVSYGTSFSPPNLFSLFAPLAEFPLPVTDRRRNNSTETVGWLTGGNPDLDAAKGESATAGVVLTPSRVPGLRLAATYWELEVNNRVTVVSAQQLVDNEAEFQSRVIRAAPTPDDIAAGLPGRITRVDITRMNFGRLKTDGVDWEASYSVSSRFGRFTPSLMGTWTGKYNAIELPGTPAIERAGVASTSGTIAKWKMSATLGWTRGGVGLSATARYLHSYDDAVFGLGPTGRRIPARTVLDTQAFLNLDQAFPGRTSWLQNLRFTAGIANLFDKEPAFSELNSDSGYDNSQGDLIGRTGYLTVTKGF